MTSLGSVCREKITAAANQLNVDTEIVKVTIYNSLKRLTWSVYYWESKEQASLYSLLKRFYSNREMFCSLQVYNLFPSVWPFCLWHLVETRPLTCLNLSQWKNTGVTFLGRRGSKLIFSKLCKSHAVIYQGSSRNADGLNIASWAWHTHDPLPYLSLGYLFHRSNLSFTERGTIYFQDNPHNTATKNF